jgi:hypothetical protein
MASERQIQANIRNASRSKGPTSALGKSRSRLNATKHGMAAELPDVEAGHSPEFLDRRTKWSAEFSPSGEAGQWAMDRAVAASFRIERCEKAIDGVIDASRDRAGLAWDQDRAVEAATIASRLAREPQLASRQLETTRAGVALLFEMWLRLVEALRNEGGWSESDASRALDLLGVPPDLRSGRTPIVGPEGTDLDSFRRALALDEVARLEGLHDEVMVELDGLERDRAMAGIAALLSKPAKLLLRYERDAWRRYREAIRDVQNPVESLVEAVPIPTAEPPSAPSFAEEQRAMIEEAAALLKSAKLDPSGARSLDEVNGLLDELERRFDAQYEAPGSSPSLVTERTQFGGIVPDPTTAAAGNSTPSGMAGHAA